MSQISYNDLKRACIDALQLQSPVYETGTTGSAKTCQSLSNLAIAAINEHGPSLEPNNQLPKGSPHSGHDFVVKEDDVGSIKKIFQRVPLYNVLQSFVQYPLEPGGRPVGHNTEYEMSKFVTSSDEGTKVVDHILIFLKLYCLNRYKGNKYIFDKIRALDIIGAWSLCSINTASDKMVGIPITARRRSAEIICFLNFKNPCLNGEVTEIMDRAVEEKWFLERDWAMKDHPTDTDTTSMTTALASIGQVFEQLAGRHTKYVLPEGTPCLLTGVYGFQYVATWDSVNKKLLWSKNLAGSQLQQAVNLDTARRDDATVENIFDYFFNGIWQGMQNAIRSWENPIVEIPSSPSLGKVVRSALLRCIPVWLQFRFVSSVLLPDMKEPFLVHANGFRLPCGTLSLNLQLRSLGNSCFIWTDEERGVVFKDYFEPESFHRELNFYHRLSQARVPWIPTLLGHISTRTKTGIFLSFEGKPVEQEAWEEVTPHLESWVAELHRLGIHHHDIAQRNVLKGPAGQFTLIDFDNAVASDECPFTPCPDLYLKSLHDY
ncbi:hypothetical protein BJ165DRAFT_1533044 [Panaeolus papilionaceus]|nr:hypothetical protein BJ165DRAFT_1533044 [Panaeolus papilionaceus]